MKRIYNPFRDRKKSSSSFGFSQGLEARSRGTAFVVVASNEASYTLPWPSSCTNGSSSMSTPSNTISWVKHGTWVSRDGLKPSSWRMR